MAHHPGIWKGFIYKFYKAKIISVPVHCGSEHAAAVSGEVSDVGYVSLSPGDEEAAHLLRGEGRLGRQHQGLAEPGAVHHHLALHLAHRRPERPHNTFSVEILLIHFIGQV